jgi:subtilisin family serine protease
MPAIPPGAPSVQLRSFHAASLALLLVTGCSIDRLPTSTAQRLASPTAAGGYGHAYGRDVDVTLATDAAAEDVASAYGATLKDTGNWRCARMTPAEGQTVDALITALTLDVRVMTVERSVAAETAESRQQSFSFDDGFGSPETYVGQPAASMLGISTAHLVTRGGGTRVAIVDTGVDLLHPMLAGRVIAGWDFLESDADPTDQADGLDQDGDGRPDEAFGHGTHVAGIVRLVAPDAGLLVARVLDAEGRGDMLDVARAIRWAVANGAKVINLSLGSLTKSDAVALALEEANAAGVVCVTSAGNTASDAPVDFPASSRYTTAVAAVNDLYAPTSFTSYGDFVEICAPGQTVRSAFPGGGYALWSGTSMSAPFVSGGFALLASSHPDWTWKRMQDRLISTARPVLGGFPGEPYVGVLDLGAAFTALGVPDFTLYDTQ